VPKSREERVAENESTFRDANEKIRQLGASLELEEDGRLFPFLCECGDLACHKVVRLTVGEYEHAREDAARFVIFPHHEDEPSTEQVVEQNDRFSLVEKVNVSRDVAEGLDTH
jgi:hypothetical protein